MPSCCSPCRCVIPTNCSFHDGPRAVGRRTQERAALETATDVGGPDRIPAAVRSPILCSRRSVPRTASSQVLRPSLVRHNWTSVETVRLALSGENSCREITSRHLLSVPRLVGRLSPPMNSPARHRSWCSITGIGKTRSAALPGQSGKQSG